MESSGSVGSGSKYASEGSKYTSSDSKFGSDPHPSQRQSVERERSGSRQGRADSKEMMQVAPGVFVEDLEDETSAFESTVPSPCHTI